MAPGPSRRLRQRRPARPVPAELVGRSRARCCCATKRRAATGCRCRSRATRASTAWASARASRSIPAGKLGDAAGPARLPRDRRRLRLRLGPGRHRPLRPGQGSEGRRRSDPAARQGQASAEERARQPESVHRQLTTPANQSWSNRACPRRAEVSLRRFCALFLDTPRRQTYHASGLLRFTGLPGSRLIPAAGGPSNQDRAGLDSVSRRSGALPIFGAFAIGFNRLSGRL